MLKFEDKDGLFDRLLRGQQGGRQRQHRAWYGPRAEWRELPINAQLDAVAKRDARLREANAPKPQPGIIEKAVALVADVITPVPQTEIARAVAWLLAVLKNGPVAEKRVRQMAVFEKIAPRTLKRAKKRADVRSIRNADRSSSWALPAATGP
jgi:hypothetical protein